MVSENILITSQLGIHLRPAGAMCNEAVKYKSDISFKYGEGTAQIFEHIHEESVRQQLEILNQK